MKDDLYRAIFRVSGALEVPVILVALASLAWVVVELGAFVVETARRRRRSLDALVAAAENARGHVDKGDRAAAVTDLATVAWGPAMAEVLDQFAALAGRASNEPRMAKLLADFDFGRQRRLARTRLLVRTGPALGLMGTLIPLSPALEGLANGDVATLSDNLRVAFSITVLGLLIGAAAFALSLFRDRIYGQDFSDLEYVAAVLTADPEPDADPGPDVAPPSRQPAGGPVIKVNPRARRHEDRAGDPLDGLVNLFDLGIVLSVGFLLAALSSLNLAHDFTDGSSKDGSTITVPTDSQTGDVPPDGEQVIGNGTEVGKVYQLDDGRLVYVVPPSDGSSPSPSPSPGTPGASATP